MRHHRKSPARHVVVHETSQLESAEIKRHGAVAITSIERTLFDLCADLPWPRVRGSIADALRQGLTSFPAMWKCLDALAARGRNGTRLFRHLLATMDEGAGVTESMLELRVLEALDAAGLPRPLPQHVVMGERGSLGRIDFAYPEAKLAIEADSHAWHLGPGAFEADRKRDQRLIAAGWTVIRVTWQQLNHDLDQFLAAVRAGLRRSAGSNAQQVDLTTGKTSWG